MRNRNGFTPLEMLKEKVLITSTGNKKKSYPGKKCVLRLPSGNLSHTTSLRDKSLTGFTLIELMLVVIIISALAAMVLPRLAGRSEQARIAAANADIKANIATALKLYELDNGQFPISSEGLQALLIKPSSASNWNGPYIEQEPVDPWGRTYVYKSPGQHRPQDYDLFSLGLDGQPGDDDITNWQ